MAGLLSRSSALVLRTTTLIACLVVVALVGGAGPTAASSGTNCVVPDPSGRQFCVTIEDRDGVSPSGLTGTGKRQVDVLAYQFYKFTVSNNGGSTLTNGAATIVLSDRVSGGGTVNSTAAFVPSGSASFCSLTSASPNKVSCSLGNLAAGATKPAFVVAYRTSTTPNVIATEAAVTVAYKEGSNGSGGANPATLDFTESTSLEPDPEASVAWSPPGQSVRLGTSPTADSQFSSMQYAVPNGKSPFVATLGESSGSVCDPSLSCFGELVTTDLSSADAGTFTASNLFHLTIAMSSDIADGGNTNGFVVSHRLDNGSFEVISQHCSSSPPASSDPLPCFTISKDNKAKLLVVDVWAFQNGGWMVGG